jgi:transcription elongation factor Elf1
MAKEVDIGRRFGRWVVLEKLDYKSKYKCKCDCGTTSNIRVYDLLKGKSIMCKNCSASSSRSNGQPISDTPEYNTWVHMNQRCHNPENKDYENYGGRGIHVCSLWRDSFESFLMCVGKKPAPDYSIERLDVNKGYEPGNVTWATKIEQARNKRSSVFVTIGDQTKTVVEWFENGTASVPLKTIYKRIERGWDPKDSVLLPLVGSTLEDDTSDQTEE